MVIVNTEIVTFYSRFEVIEQKNWVYWADVHRHIVKSNLMAKQQFITAGTFPVGCDFSTTR